MSLIKTHGRLELPGALQTQLHDFRRRVWSIKMIEAACGAVFGIVVPFLLMFGADRLWNSPVGVRLALFVLTVGGCALVPLAWHRWVWRNRRLEQLARLLSRRHPHIGDQLLGIIELVGNEAEQARSPALCEAAVEQVARDAQKRDFRDSVPNPRHRLWSTLATVPTLVAVGLAVLYPSATANAWLRLLSPLENVPRYTFAAFEPVPDRLIVAHGEPFVFTAQLTANSLSHPAQGTVQLGQQPPVSAMLRDGHYEFELASQIEPGRLAVRIGDFVQNVEIEPRLRPELTSVTAAFSLPEYLGQPGTQTRDVRGGLISLVNGSQLALTATAGRKLTICTVDGKSCSAQCSPHLPAPPFAVDGTRRVQFQWTDEYGLAGKEPFVVTIAGKDDEAPSVVVEDLPRQRVVLETEVLSFKVRARDDFGVHSVGIEWKGVENPVVKSPAVGEKLLSAGGPDKDSLELDGTFSAKSLGIEAQPVNVRVFVEDYFPGRARVYSSPHTFYVLTAEQHSIWITEQMSKWHRQSLEVRDRELQLYETNKQLRELAEEELDQPETRRKIEQQATAERANGRRLSNLTAAGEELVRQAMRNPEIGVGHLEKWAEMLQILKDISGNRMPSVADLLKQSSQAPAVAMNQPANKSPMAGQIRASGSGKPGAPPQEEQKPKPAVPKIVDVESSQQPASKKQNEDEPPPPAGNKTPTLRLPVTTLMGDGSGKKKPPAPAEEKLDEAIQQQQDLLAEFEKIADELNRVLANLEGSTLVKRLKAASRMQYKIGGRINDQLKDTFGVAPSLVAEKPLKVIDELAEQESKASLDVSFIMDDMQAYFERRRFMKFKSVLDDMRQQDVIGSLRQLGDDVRKENGMSMAQTDFWSDTLDRWAEDLVDPACCGSCPGCKSKGSLPPSIILEVMLILEGEINLRDETRVAEQARPALAEADHRAQATKLSETQDLLRERIDKVIERIRELPDGEADFAKEIRLLGLVSQVMNEATGILAKADTGKPAIAAETEAIELLLQSKRINPKGGGGGGSSPGGGGGGTTNDSALTLVGSGVNDKEVRDDRGVSQASGEAGPTLPEEFRAGLDEYFNRLERPGRE